MKNSETGTNVLRRMKKFLRGPDSEVIETCRMTLPTIKSNTIAAPIACKCLQASGRNPRDSPNNTDSNIPAEKSSLILVAIVLVFLLNHSFRLALKVYEALMPEENTYENYKRCFSLGR